MKFDLNDKVKEKLEEAWETARKQVAFAEASRKYADTFRRISYFYDVDVYLFGVSLILLLNVKSLKEAEAALEMIEDEHGVTFNKSSDWAAEKVLERSFTAENLGFKVDVRVTGDSPTCRSVIVGYEQVPKYEIRCDDEEQK